MWGDRTGREPASARSPLTLRRVSSLIGAALCLCALVLLAVAGQKTWWTYAVLAVVAAAALVDAYVLGRRIRSGHRHPD
jgi:membrane protein YdbS with pleckstrin-like domain